MVKKVIRFIVLIIGLSLVAYSGYHLFKIYSDYNTSDKTYEKLQDEYAVDDSKTVSYTHLIYIYGNSKALTIQICRLGA